MKPTDPVKQFAADYHVGRKTSSDDQTLYYTAVERGLIVPPSRKTKRLVPPCDVVPASEPNRKAVASFAKRYNAGLAVSRDSTWLFRQAKDAGLLLPRHQGRRCRVRQNPKLLDVMAKMRRAGKTLAVIASRFALSREGVRRMLIIRGVEAGR